MTDTRVGLTEAEVAARRKKYGLNQMRYVRLSSPDFLVPGGEAAVWMPSLPGYLRERRESWSAVRDKFWRELGAGGKLQKLVASLGLTVVAQLTCLTRFGEMAWQACIDWGEDGASSGVCLDGFR